MAANAMNWPAALWPRQAHFSPTVQSRSGGLSLNGSEQVTVSDAGRWQARVTVAIRGEETNLALRAFLAQMGGRAGTVLVPKVDAYRPVDINGRMLSQVFAAGYDDGTPQDGNGFNFDLSGFGQQEDPVAQIAANAGAGSTRVLISTGGSVGPRPGHYFGVGQRIYLASHVWQEEEGDPADVQFWPRLRTSAELGSPAILDKPMCLMRFASDEEGQEALSRRGSGIVTFNMVEAI